MVDDDLDDEYESRGEIIECDDLSDFELQEAVQETFWELKREGLLGLTLVKPSTSASKDETDLPGDNQECILDF